MRSFVTLAIVLAACSSSPAAGPTDEEISSACPPVIAAIEGMDPTDVVSIQATLEVVATNAITLDPINSATLVAEATGLKASVQAGGNWSTERLVSAINDVCKSDLVPVANG